MRTLSALALAASVLLVPHALPGMPALAAADAPAAATGSVMNLALLQQLAPLADQLTSVCGEKLKLAKTAAAIPFAGSSAKKSVEQAQGQLDAASGLSAELTGLLAGKAPATGGILSQLGTPTGATSLTDKFKSIPGAETLLSALSQPGVAQALIQMTPVDKVPGYAMAASLLGMSAK